ncbi:MAG: aryl-sulfate sulfotransferase [Bryobacteraceae bacterium]
MKHSKAWFIVLAGVAIFAGAASAQVRCKVPAATVVQQPTGKADKGEGLMMTSFFQTKQAKQCVGLTNLQGQPAWSYCTGGNLFMTRAVPGGTVLLISNNDYTDYTLTELNMAGATVNSITEATANSQLAALGQQSIIDFNHEAMRLPNGYTVVIAHNEALYTDVQGGTTQTPVDVMGDEILVLDTNWNVVWTWNGFDWLPVNRTAILGETCTPCANIGSGGCCPITLAPVANDWLHGNSITYDSTDGNLIMSMRHQDWVIKIDYENGAGDGHVIWTLGYQGDFTMVNTPNVPSPWFSHQHDVEIWTNKNPKLLTVFDNGNTRHTTDPSADSRGQVLTLNEQAMTADIHTNLVFPFFSGAYGTSQILDNGNYWFQAGVVGGPNGPEPTRSYEYVPSGYSGTKVYGIEFADTAYRSFRLDAASGF